MGIKVERPQLPCLNSVLTGQNRIRAAISTLVKMVPSLRPVSNWWNTMVTASRSSAVNSSTAVWWVDKNKCFTEKYLDILWVSRKYWQLAFADWNWVYFVENIPEHLKNADKTGPWSYFPLSEKYLSLRRTCLWKLFCSNIFHGILFM